jgi:hypothetical protein
MIATFKVMAPTNRETLIRMELPKNQEILRLPTLKIKECIQYVWERRDANY